MAFCKDQLETFDYRQHAELCCRELLTDFCEQNGKHINGLVVSLSHDYCKSKKPVTASYLLPAPSAGTVLPLIPSGQERILSIDSKKLLLADYVSATSE